MLLERDTDCVYSLSQTHEMIGRLELIDRWSLRWVNNVFVDDRDTQIQQFI